MDKIPFGTKYAYEHLNFIFPQASIRTSDRFPEMFPSESGDDTTRTLIIVSPIFAPEPGEMQAILRFAASGNQVFISSPEIEDTIQRMMHLKQQGSYFDIQDSGKLSILEPNRNEWQKYAYPGLSYNNYFESIDTGHTKVLGKNSLGLPDFIKIYFKHGGAIFVHLNPFAFSNFFLLHKKNKTYYDIALSYMPVKTGVVEWSDYFRYSHQADHFSALHFILGNRSLRWAFWLTLLLFLLMFVVEFKRKQQAIGEIPPLRNASEDFVKTVGQLYFQQKDNQNLAAKMISAFLENIRSAYNLPTSELNEDFSKKLSFRTGRPADEINRLIQLIHSSRLNPFLSDEELMDLHGHINQFNIRVS
jgi:hypothetical protein